MERKWTDKQKKVIDSRDKNLLVSAAAGSGKTAVLVARIIKMITDTENPVDIDKLVIITFTRAAAAQMRRKIADELEKLIEKEPENELYRRQQKLLGNAVISTIDSFCIGIVRAYFQRLELDPGFRMADETELKLIESDAMDELMEKYHNEGTPDFYYLIEAYCNYRSDEKLTEFISLLARKAEAQPWPEKWLDSLIQDYEIKDGSELSNSRPAQAVFYHAREIIEAVVKKIQKAEELCCPDGSDTDLSAGFLSTIKEDKEAVSRLLEKKDFRSLGAALSSIPFGRLSSKKTGDDKVKDRVKEIRNKYIKEITDLSKDFFPSDADSVAELIRKSKPAVSCLIEMTKEYRNILMEKKKEKNVIDFSDAEHFALDILWGDTPEALELRNEYREIIIDEYQDSNNVQEYIANAIAGAFSERPYIFTVGDVKQSIYKFRNARPELFMEKQERFGAKEDNGELFILDNNFRSREEVLLSTNAVFKHIMRKEIGGIEYNDECSLKRGTDAQIALGEASPYKSEAYIISDKLQEDDAPEPKKVKEDNEIPDKNVLEARFIAKRIKKLVYEEKLQVSDEEKEGSFRNVRFGDIVILLRTMKEWSSVFAEILESEGIPVFTEEADGFFKSSEVRLVIDFLKILDNPRQDIPFAAVLHSVIAGLSEEELALIRICAGKTETFYDAVLSLTENVPEKEDDKLRKIRGKLARFIELYRELDKYRQSASVSELIDKIYRSTDICDYYSAMPDGEMRKANLDMLPIYAVQYENTSYSGLFSFIRYYDKLLSKDLDYGEAGSKAAGNSVRIMSIHKSKGLEFPVVFVAGLGKEFNLKDFSGDICVSADNGLGIKYVDIERRIKYPSFYHSIIRMRGTADIIGEEMRLLYVAMTRAKDKLILLGTTGRSKPGEGTDYASLFKAKSFLDFIYPVLVPEKEHFISQVISPETAMNIISEENGYETEENDEIQQAKELSPDEEIILEKLEKARSAEYPYQASEAVPVKMSVSELKLQSIEEEFGEDLFEETREFQPGDKTVPDFLKGEEKVSRGADYGTLVHKCMQFIPMQITGADEVESFFDAMEKQGRLNTDERGRLSVKKFVEFLDDPIAERIRKADSEGKFYREKQFMFTLPANRINAEKYAGITSPVPIQGVIDAMFIEDGELVILDYKTDSLKPGCEEELVKKYRTQLDIYAEAAERLMGMKVKEKLLYSFAIGKVIQV